MNKITVQVISIERRGGNRENYAEIELLQVQDGNGKRFGLTRFRRNNENKLCEGYWYQGTQKKSTKEGYNDIFQDVEYLEGGKDGVASPFFPQPNEKELDSRQKSILVQSDMRTAAILMATYATGLDETTWAKQYENLYNTVKQFREQQEENSETSSEK